MEAPDLAGLAQSKDLNALKNRLTQAEVAMKTVATTAAKPNYKCPVSKSDFDAMKKETNTLKATVEELKARVSRIDAPTTAKHNKRPAAGPSESCAKLPRHDVNDGPPYEYAGRDEWQMLRDRDGIPFYYNQYTQVKQWTPPFVVPPSSGGMMMPPPPSIGAANINITNANNTNTNIAVPFSPETTEIYGLFDRGLITSEQLMQLKEARTMTKSFKK
jgi:hypothetical protein